MIRALGRLAAVSLLVAASAQAGPRDESVPAPPPATLADAEKELGVLDRRLFEFEGRAGKITADIALRDRRSIARARAYARLARAGLLPVAGGFDALVSHAMKIESARRAILADLDSLKSLRKEHQAALGARDALASRRAVVAAQRDALGQAQALLEEAEDRKRSFERAFQSSGAASESGHVAVYGAGITVRDAEAPAPSGGGFPAVRGRLPFPVAGRAEVKSARRESASGPGLELKAPSGSSVRAVFSGRVAFSARYGDYGRLVIVDHGDHWFTVYGNLGTVDGKVGDELSSGGRVGAVGDEGSGSMMYFEVRHGSETVDPKPWLGL